MKEFVEKLIERLEEKISEYDIRIQRRNGSCYYDESQNQKKLDNRARGIEQAIEIVNQLAEEYKQDLNKNKQGWIPCSEMLPEPEKEVLIMANRKYTGGKIIPIITTAIYENGTILENDSIWNWSDIEGEWNEEEECYIIPEGWFEYRHYNPDEVYNNAIDDKVIAWQPLPEPYKPEQQKEIPVNHYIERFNKVQ